MSNFDIVVSTASGIESVTAKELKNLGFASPKAIDGRFNLYGDALAIARLNMFLRTAERVFIKIAEYQASDFDALFDGAKDLPWENFIAKNDKIVVNGKSTNSQLFSIRSCQSILKKAILQRLSKVYRIHNFAESGNLFNIEFTIRNDIVVLLLNTSGAGLHKRSYRTLVGEAPIKETLASAMLLLSDFDGDKPFIDPFCGSGTILLEAANIALNIASGKNRHFDYQYWDFFNKQCYQLALQEASDTEIDKKLYFSGFDIDKKAISLALSHAKNANLADKVHIQAQDISKLQSRLKNGCIVTNPPYGHRLSDEKDANKLYQTLGEVYRSLNNWSLFVITPAPQFEKYLKIPADKNRKLYNANVECRFYQYFRKNI